MAAKQSKTGGPKSAQELLSAMLLAEKDNVTREREELEAKWKKYERKHVISPENAVATVHRIAEFCGVDELPSIIVKEVAEFVIAGRLTLKENRLIYRLRRPLVKGEGNTQIDFEISEVPDQEMAENGVDAFHVGMLTAQGRHDEITQDDIRKIARLAIRLPEDFAAKLPAREIMAIYGLYTTFFLVR